MILQIFLGMVALVIANNIINGNDKSLDIHDIDLGDDYD